MKVNFEKIIYWTPRVLSIMFILFLLLFSFDVFDSESTILEMLIGFLIHNIPVFVLSIVLMISWKYEIVGGIGFVLAGLVYSCLVLSNVFKTGFEWYYLVWILQISGIAFLIGILFLINWFKKK